MKLTPYYIYIACMTVVLSACSGSDLSDSASLSDEAMEQMANAKLVSFSAGGTEKQVTRAEDKYRDWGKDKDGNVVEDFKTMGVFGWHDLSSTSNNESANMIFYNTENRYGDNTNTWTSAWKNPSTNWTYESPKYWADYTTYNSFDFFACMPYVEGATFAHVSGDVYKLSVPVTIKDGENASAFTTSETAYLSDAKHLSAPGYESGSSTIPFKFDQTLAGFNLEFQLGEKMSKIRQFRVKSVKITSGGDDKVATSGIATRTYTWNSTEKTWSSGKIQWESITKNSTPSIEKAIEQVAERYNTLENYNKTNGTSLTEGQYTALGEEAQKYLLVTNTARQWGSNIFFIPSATDFTPTLSVTYDVEVVAEDGTTYITRKDVTSSITVNSTNFPDWKSGEAGKVNPGNIIKLHINIVPDYLYVLSEYDQTTGVLVVETK